MQPEHICPNKLTMCLKFEPILIHTTPNAFRGKTDVMKPMRISRGFTPEGSELCHSIRKKFVLGINPLITLTEFGHALLGSSFALIGSGDHSLLLLTRSAVVSFMT